MSDQYFLYKEPSNFFKRLFTKKLILHSSTHKYILKDGDMFRLIDSMNFFILILKPVNIIPDNIIFIKRSDLDKFIRLEESQVKKEIRKQKLKKLCK